MTPAELEAIIDGRVRSLVELDGATRTSIGDRAREILAGEYAPALEAELTQRSQSDVAATVKAVADKLK